MWSATSPRCAPAAQPPVSCAAASASGNYRVPHGGSPTTHLSLKPVARVSWSATPRISHGGRNLADVLRTGFAKGSIEWVRRRHIRNRYVCASLARRSDVNEVSAR
jgi:hypothetical protein